MDWLINDALPVLARILIVCIFPFSFIDKIINWDNALKQTTSSWLPGGPVLLILAMIVESLTPPMIVFKSTTGSRRSFSVVTVSSPASSITRSGPIRASGRHRARVIHISGTSSRISVWSAG